MPIPMLATAAAVIGVPTVAVVCLRGVVVESGRADMVEWRVRFACWRYFADVMENGEWTQIGTFKLSQRAMATTLAKTDAARLAHESVLGGGASSQWQPATPVVARLVTPGDS